MKKLQQIFSVATVVAMTLTGCSQVDDFATNSELTNNESTAISFGTYMSKAKETRVTGGAVGDITTKVLQESAAGFGVMAYAKGTNGATDCYTTGAWNASKPNFMFNQQVTYSTNHWTYTPVKFWPNDFANNTKVDDKQGTDETDYATGSAASGKVSFFAYAPYVAPNDYSTKSSTHKLNSTDDTAFDVYSSGSAATDGIVAMTANDYEGEPQVKYVLGNASLTNAVDLLWGKRPAGSYDLATGTTGNTIAEEGYNLDLTKQAVDETIDFYFKHALSKIGGNFYQATPEVKNSGVQVVLDIDNGSLNGGTQNGTSINGGTKEDATFVTISDIKIEDVKTYYERTSNNARGTTSNLVNSGWFNIAKGTWSEATSTGATYSSSVANTNTVATDGYALNPDLIEKTVTYDGGWKINGTLKEGVTTTAKNLFDDTSNVPALLLIPAPQNQTLVVTITYLVRTRDAKLSTGYSEISQTITNAVTFPSGSLKSNTYYKLLIHLGLTSVKFSATVAPWDTATSGGEGGNDNDADTNDKDIWLPSNTL